MVLLPVLGERRLHAAHRPLFFQVGADKFLRLLHIFLVKIGDYIKVFHGLPAPPSLVQLGVGRFHHACRVYGQRIRGLGRFLCPKLPQM